MWYNKYVGIPYKDKGRDESGLDCWGLVRLVYSKEYGIELPSFTETYSTAHDTQEVALAIDSHRYDNWTEVPAGIPGSVIVFSVLGTQSHVGIYLGNNLFMHAREGVDSVVIEKLDSVNWSKRFKGFFEYTQKTDSATVSAAPHPLKTETISFSVEPGTTVKQLVDKLTDNYKITKEIPVSYVVFKNGQMVEESAWDTTVAGEGDQIDYRVIAKGGGNPFRTILMIALVVVTYYYAPGLAASLAESGIGTATAGVASAGTVAATAMVMNMAGMALINAIAPVRMPTMNSSDPGTPSRQNLFSGGSNLISKYAPIPVVLGKMRITPSLAAQQFVDLSDPEKSSLTSLVTWGFGPLDVTDIQIGTNDLGFYSDYRIKTLYGYSTEDQNYLDDIYGSDVEQQVLNVKLLNVDPTLNPDNLPESALNPWTEVTLNQPCDRLDVAIHFPEGLRTVQIKDDGAGSVSEAPFTATIQYRELDNSGNPITNWLDNSYRVEDTTFSIPFITNAGNEYYRWVSVYVTTTGILGISHGPNISNKDIDPTVNQGRYSGGSQTISRFGDIPPRATKIYDLCFYGTYTSVIEVIDRRQSLSMYYGMQYSISIAEDSFYQEMGDGSRTIYYQTGFNLSIAHGTYSIDSSSVLISIGESGQDYYKKKDAFTIQRSISVKRGNYQVRVKRTNLDTSDIGGSSESPLFKRYHAAYLYAITGTSNSKPTKNPPGCFISKSALKILSSDNINGRLEGINGLVHSVCMNWNSAEQQWNIQGPTSNPASLFLHVLTHPANLYRVEMGSSRLDLAGLGSWYEYCETEGFSYNNVLDSTRSVLEVLRDIAAAGRASPTLIDGKWSVIIDRPRSHVSQYFTPHNSWGFESTKVLPRMPDAFRVVFRNEEKSYQDDQVLVCNIGYTQDTAAIIEEISLPGITTAAAAFKHAKWHLAQLRLRPERYTLNTDFEYLVCNRGDLVRVAHDVPLWGTGTGRIKQVINSTTLQLEEPVYLQGGIDYTIRIRLDSGESVTATLLQTATDTYDTIELTAAINSAVAPGNLFMLGEVNSETQELIVLGIEPIGNMSARLTLMDYSPQIYTMDDSSQYNFPEYDPNITITPEKLIDSVRQIPVLNSALIKSDESVLTVNSGGTIISNINVPFTNVKDLPKTVSHIEIQYDEYEDTPTNNWQYSVVEKISASAVLLPDVVDLQAYKIRARYINNAGTYGKWSATVAHTVVGKTSKPSDVPASAVRIDTASRKAELSWSPVYDKDLVGYEVRNSDSNWGLPGFSFRGSSLSCLLDLEPAGSDTLYYIKAYDVLGNYSNLATSASVAVTVPTVPSVIQDSINFNSTSLTNTNLIIKWSANTLSGNMLPIDHYDVQLVYSQPVLTNITDSRKTLEWSVPVSWTGTATFKIRAVDVLGNVSPYSSPISITKVAPNNVTQPTVSVKGTGILVTWNPTTKGSLPIAGYEIRNTDENWGFPGAVWSGNANNTTISMVGSTSGTYTWYIRAYDAEGSYSNNATVIQYVLNKPQAPSNITTVFQDTSLTNASATISWSSVTPEFGLYGYEISYDGKTLFTKSNTITIPASWVGTKQLSISTIDGLISSAGQNKSNPAYTTVEVRVPNPVPVSSYKYRVIDNTVILYWEYPEVTTLPISHIRIKSGGTSWADADLIGDKSGTFTSFSELSAGEYTYRVAVVDTENNESPDISLTFKVDQPPNYVFNGQQSSNFNSTNVVNGVKDPNSLVLVMPVNTSENFAGHFTSNNWTGPQQQITAGYPYYLQPGTLTGSYSEVFDFGNLLSSSQITVSIGMDILSGAPVVNHTIYTSIDNFNYVPYKQNMDTVLATNFRFVKVLIEVSQNGSIGSLVAFRSMTVRLDSKTIYDAGKVVVHSGVYNGVDHTNGTIVNFDKEFVDIASISLAANSSTPAVAVYDHKDAVIDVTFTNFYGTTCLIESSVPHGLVAGQAVRVSFLTSSIPGAVMPIGIYTVTSVINPLTYNITLPASYPQGWGTALTYSNSMRVFVFDNSGNRLDNVQVSWNVQGY